MMMSCPFVLLFFLNYCCIHFIAIDFHVTNERIRIQEENRLTHAHAKAFPSDDSIQNAKSKGERWDKGGGLEISESYLKQSPFVLDRQSRISPRPSNKEFRHKRASPKHAELRPGPLTTLIEIKQVLGWQITLQIRPHFMEQVVLLSSIWPIQGWCKSLDDCEWACMKGWYFP